MTTLSLLLILTSAFLTEVTNSRRIYEIPLINNRQRIKIDNVNHNDMVDFESMETLQTHHEEIHNQSETKMTTLRNYDVINPDKTLPKFDNFKRERTLLCNGQTSCKDICNYFYPNLKSLHVGCVAPVACGFKTCECSC
ncbi:uncharacterized protein LOC142353177 [Convolutriloba macropyga]|uniref:uncharacterized protein LOC142353177 n=1 Tax=Convolutriloba macropyga TaxID=536237 RepID=UPI003F528826